MGILFSKIAELAMMHVLREDISFGFSVSLIAIRNTTLFFLGIFALIFAETLRQIRFSKPIELLGSEKTGEKPPKSRWIMAVLGLLLLVIAYAMAVSIKNPMTALTVFFFSVIMVIIATYLLFIAASVALCKVLKNIKGYYYRTNHFVSVSSMAYRMKRNGAGLATICILSTMVLVMISSTLCLNLGMEKMLRSVFPREIMYQVSLGTDAEVLGGDRQIILDLLSESAFAEGKTPNNILCHESANLMAIHVDGQFDYNAHGLSSTASSEYWSISIISLQDYNRLSGSNESIEPGEVLIQTKNGQYNNEQITIGNAPAFRVKKQLSGFETAIFDGLATFPSMLICVPDLPSFIEPFQEDKALYLYWNYAFDFGGDDALQTRVYESVLKKSEAMHAEPNPPWEWFEVQSLAEFRTTSYSVFGGMFFLGVLLSIVFLIATVLIIYYKQISEGYEDRERFDIMQKVGMTRKEIKKAINSQVLIVFFLPLLTAGLHLGFAFPFISKFLKLLGLDNTPFLILVSVASFLIFGLFYILVYRFTSQAYFKIVSDGQRE